MAYVGNGYAWWVGQDGNIWANIDGNVKKMAEGSLDYRDENGLWFNAVGKDNIGDYARLYRANQISDPNVSNQPQANGDDWSGSYATGGSGSGSTYDKNAVDFWNSTIQQYENQLNGLNDALAEKNKQTDSDYNTKRNELQSNYDRSKSEYDQSTTRNKQQLQTNRNTISDRASQGLRGLLRTLGAMGAGGSSSALYNAPELVTAQANQERAGADQTFGENQQKLDTNWGNYLIDYDNDKKKLEDWKQGQYRSNEQDVLNSKNSILSNLMNAYAERASAGQGYGNRLNELTGQITGNQNRLNELNRFTAPSYDGTRANYNAPSLSSYNTGNTSLTTQIGAAPQAGFNANSTPTLAMLLGNRNRKDSNPYGRS